MKKKAKRKPYKLGLRAEEVSRLNMLEGTYPEKWKVGQPSREWIAERVKRVNEAVKLKA